MNSEITQHLNASVKSALGRYEFESEPFFSYLKSRGNEGINAKQFVAYRDNYLYRTSWTAIAVAKVVIAAVRNHDEFATERAGKNLFEETGEGRDHMSHPFLMREAHNIHGRVVHGCAPTSFEEADRSSSLLPEALSFRKTQKSCYESPCYLTVLGASFAQESAARQMLEVIYYSIFEPFRDKYAEPAEFDAVARYFLVHINGLEEAHAEDAKALLLNACRNSSDVDAAVRGAVKFLGAQSRLWQAMHRQLVGLETTT